MSFNQLIIQQTQSIDYTLQESDFDLNGWRSRSDSQPLAGGRGASQKIEIAGHWFVLRQYLRGGLVARVLNDQYLWTGLTRSRPYQEHQVVEYAIRNELPVPAVVAYRVHKTGLFYRAAIISRFILNQGTLAGFLANHQLPPEHWLALGRLIRQLHLAHIWHADLNANNILIGADMNFYLIDFDKAKIMSEQGAWTDRSLQRLLRSLHKIRAIRQQQQQAFHFEAEHWQLLLDGYR